MRSVIVSSIALMAFGDSGQVLHHHSFARALNFNNTLADWVMGGVIMPLNEHVSVLPGVDDRAASFFHKYPILSDDWQAVLTFTVEGPDMGSQMDSGFAFWAVSHNVTESYDTKKLQTASIPTNRFLVASELDLLAFPGTFNGVGILVQNVLHGVYNPNVGVLHNTGARKLSGHDRQYMKATPIQFRNAGRVKLIARFNRGHLTVTMDCRGQRTVVYDEEGTHEMSYIGFTAVTGDPVSGIKPDKVNFYDFTVENMDRNAAGENVPEDHGSDSSAWSNTDFLHAHSFHKAQREQNHAFQELTHVVYKLISETEPLRHQMQHAIEKLNDRVHEMEETLKNLKVEVGQATGHDLDKEFRQVQEELMNLATFTDTHHRERQDKLEKLHQDVAMMHSGGTAEMHEAIRSITLQNQELHQMVSSSSSKTFWLSIVAILVILAAGVGLYKKFLSWEKKHIL